VYTYHLEVGLADHNEYGLDNIGEFPFKVFIANSCDQSSLLMEELSDVIVTLNQSAREVIKLPTPTVAISQYRESLESNPTSIDYITDLCGVVQATAALVDGDELPGFMFLNEDD